MASGKSLELRDIKPPAPTPVVTVEPTVRRQYRTFKRRVAAQSKRRMKARQEEAPGDGD